MAVSSSLEGVKLTIRRSFANAIDKTFPVAKVRVAARAAAQEEIDIIRKRTWQERLDVNGKPLKGLSARYLRWKTDVIKAGWKVKRGRGTSARRVSLGPTAFAASKASDMMRLSGRMYSDMYVRDLTVERTDRGIRVQYSLDFKTARSKKIAGYHINIGVGRQKIKRKFWGPAKRAEDMARIERAFRKALTS